ncbi:hypothetical protein [Cellulomonas biazotea]|uniref:Asp23/Gls24 family envelope stress response protein n=1 Tax=Cellulomonas biazotea TaxID=1709 RepID=A0A402DTW1_9CELL|nr:hypothetical protein [Cellulomonas biazotea]GCE77589.1 hypothetical protein CBZ_26450 [Cellulomonas biazotea]
MNGEQLVDHATRLLREHTDAGWVALRDDVVALATRAFRSSAPVRGHLPGGELWVASSVVVSQVRAALARVPDAGPLRIACTTTPDGRLDRLTVEVVALYGTPLVPLAGRVRTAAAEAVAATLGLATPPDHRVAVDVSVGDVTSDPRAL